MTGTDIYRSEIFNFLRTVSIKFEPFAYLMGKSYMEQYGITDPHGEWNPYYLNLSGEYSSNDERMTVYSIEENKYVPFDKDTKLLYPKTASVYKIPNVEYTTLEEKYPANVGLIRTITYPVPSITQAIEAPNLSLLAYDDSLLHVNERESIVKCLKTFLEMVRVRWWIPEYAYEDMYAVTFWALLWQHLPNLLLTQRFQNIRTPYVHPFHIWEYLISKGIPDYRDVLTNNQSLWLYRNVHYIQKNKGKHSNLVILAENLLAEAFVSLTYKDMYQETFSHWSVPRTTPEFISFDMVTNTEINTESFRQLNDKLVESGIEDRYSAEFIEQTEEELGLHNYNILSTKFLEFKKDDVNTMNEQLMANFFLDTLMFKLKEDKLAFKCTMLEPVNNTRLELYIQDMVLLWYYAVQRSVDRHPVEIPSIYPIRKAFQLSPPRNEDLKSDILYHGVSYDNTALIDIDRLTKVIPWDSLSHSSNITFMQSLLRQWAAYLWIKQLMEQSNKYVYHLAMQDFFSKTTINEVVELQLTTLPNYEAWIESNEKLKLVIDLADEKGNVDIYHQLAEKAFDSIFLVNEETAAGLNLVINTRVLDNMYSSIRDLFIQLGSYNVTYLETDRSKKQYLVIPDTGVVHTKYSEIWDGVLDTVMDDPIVDPAWDYDPALDGANVEFISSPATNTYIENTEIETGTECILENTTLTKSHTEVNPIVKSTEGMIHLRWKINIDNINAVEHKI